jgi:hypothetical protein
MLYQHTIYEYANAPPEFRNLFTKQGDYIVVISGVSAVVSEYASMWYSFPDDMFTGIWDLFAFVHQATGAKGERVFLLIEMKARP